MIGYGGFSKVFLSKTCKFLARNKITQQLQALKVIEKQFIIDNDKQDIIINELTLMKNMNHPFIVKLEYAFQTVKIYYI